MAGFCLMRGRVILVMEWFLEAINGNHPIFIIIPTPKTMNRAFTSICGAMADEEGLGKIDYLPVSILKLPSRMMEDIMMGWSIPVKEKCTSKAKVGAVAVWLEVLRKKGEKRENILVG
ncbi:Uncharacterized protein Fot_26348 [Forsythia ovata]|uniref:Uncharacterized protein n=1 Tax=Forsythia ovata TaxID=205694 RepID=A0ABD1UCY0_9LAMI